MACENRNTWFELTWWHEVPFGPKVCGWPSRICNESGWHHSTVGGVGDIFGPSWFNTEHFKNENFDYTSPTRKFLADKWWGDGGSTGWSVCSQMAWMHASSRSGRKSERWPTAPFASSITGFPCKSLDSYEPPGFCQRSPYILSCSSDPCGLLRSGPPENLQTRAGCTRCCTP